jgi:diamine N-acetyltransferase
MIEGKRIRLRAIERSDLPKFVEWLNDPEVIDNLYLYAPMSLGQEEEWYKKTLTQPVDEQVLAIEVKEKGGFTMIGTLAFVGINWHDHSGEVGISIGEKSYWNKGYGTEAMQALIRHGFNKMGLNRVWLRVYETNSRGIRAYEKAGFVHEGTLRQARWKDGKFINMHVMSVLRNEWTDKE